MKLWAHFCSGLHRRRFFAIWLLAFLVTAGAGWHFWPWRKTVEPPTIDQGDADPEVVEAIEAARMEVRQSPRSTAAWGKLGQVFVAHNYDDRAIICFSQAEDLDAKEARWPYLHGLTLLFSDTESAIIRFQCAVQLQGNSPAMRLRLAEALLSQARLDEAEEQFQRLLALEPGNPRGYLGLGRLAYLREDPQTSRDFLRQAAASPLTKKAAHILLAEVAQRSNDPAEAARERQLASEMPNDQDWHDPVVDEVEQMRAGKQARLDYALKQLRQNNSTEGRRLLRKLMADYPDWAAVWLSQGRMLLENQDYLEAEDALRLEASAGFRGGQFQPWFGSVSARRLFGSRCLFPGGNPAQTRLCPGLLQLGPLPETPGEQFRSSGRIPRGSALQAELRSRSHQSGRVIRRSRGQASSPEASPSGRRTEP
jgi:cytochrome c-type biogenesis protein CcmH/NrfG